MRNRDLNYYVEDILSQLIDEAIDVRKNIDNEFDKGRLFGYYEIISKFLNQAEAFNIIHDLPMKVRDFNPEDLIKEL
jgi:hypothetical protein